MHPDPHASSSATKSTDEGGRVRFDGLDPRSEAKVTIAARDWVHERFSLRPRAEEHTLTLRCGGPLSILVQDGAGDPVPLVRLRLLRVATGTEVEAVTNKNGRLRVPSFPAGEYEVRARRNGATAEQFLGTATVGEKTNTFYMQD